MKKLIFTLIAIVSALGAGAQVQIPYQEINYNVKYHFGLVKVNIGHGMVTMGAQGQNFKATLDGHTIPWEGKVFCISDTLMSTLTSNKPLSNSTVTYQNGWYMKPASTVYNAGAFEPSNPANYKNTLGQGDLDASNETMEAITISTDMLSLFYYFHEIDFKGMTEGQQITIPISVAGGEPRSVKVVYNGTSSYEGMSTYNVTFEFTYHGTPSGYQVKVEVAQESLIPVLISASLPIGHVEMRYVD